MTLPRRLEKAIVRHGKKHRKFGKKLMPVGHTIYFLKIEKRTKKFTKLAEFAEYDKGFDKFRNKPTFEVATVDEDFGREVIALMTHIAELPSGQMYSVRNADEPQAMLLDFTYKISGDLIGQIFDESDLAEVEEV